MSKISSAFKYTRQFGLRPLFLYGLYKLGIKTGYYKRVTPILDLRSSNIESSNSARLFMLPDSKSLLQILGAEGQASLLNEAHQIVNGKVKVFGETLALDFSHNQPLQHWTFYETDFQPSTFNVLHNDIKYLWEPARFGFAFTLGRAYHLTQENQYAEAFWRHFEAFTKNNPVHLGPHWMNGQEVAIRLLALVWASHVFESAPATSAERSAALRQSMYQHANRIPFTLIYARSQNNNHLITEAAAIYTAGLFFKNTEWRKLGWRWLHWALQNQIGGFGEYIQHSVNYHRVMLQTALWVNFIKQDVFPTGTTQALARSTHWLFSLLDNASGRTPNLGANDGALIFPLSATPFEDYRPTVQAAARAFLRNSLTSGVWDETALWFGLKATARESDSDIYLTDNLHAKNSWGYLRASNFKSRLGHMDQLHFDLWWRGLNVAQDAGTYLYNAAPPWDNPLATTRVHNTLTVDGQDQMTRVGKFLTLDWANGYAKPVIDLNEKVLHRVRAYHTGYRRLQVKHQRTVTVYADDVWEVEDRLLNGRRRFRTYRLHWLLLDGPWTLEQDELSATLKIQTTRGTVQLVVRHPANVESAISLARAGELLIGQRKVQPYEGWVSRNYGEKTPALSLALEVESMYQIVLTSEFRFMEQGGSARV
ncbi:MAG: alginate lyase family protein [Anaerolineales bacterium]|nr:alginate lyase family protein [Anaerolineales bacterium]